MSAVSRGAARAWNCVTIAGVRLDRRRLDKLDPKKAKLEELAS